MRSFSLVSTSSIIFVIVAAAFLKIILFTMWSLKYKQEANEWNWRRSKKIFFYSIRDMTTYSFSPFIFKYVGKFSSDIFTCITLQTGQYFLYINKDLPMLS